MLYGLIRGIADWFSRRALLAYALYLVAIALSVAVSGWHEGWRPFGVPAAALPFLDMRTVQGALFSLDLGLDPRLNNPADPDARPMNYPLVWLAVADFFGLRGEPAFLIFAGGMVALFLASVFVLLRRYPSAALLFALVSNASLLLIERGNNDLLVFALLFVLATYLQRVIGIGCLIAAVVLKIYPVFALVLLVLRRQPPVFLGALAICLGVLGFTAGELSAIHKATPYSAGMSYGWPSTRALIGDKPLAMAAYSLCLLAIALLVARAVASCGRAAWPRDHALEALFVVGASVYCGTYLFAANWDYRLVMLVFCVPALSAGEVGNRRLSGVLLAAVLIAMNIQWLHNVKSQLVGAISDLLEPETSDWVYWFRVPFFAVDHTLKAFLFGGLAGVLLARLAARWRGS